MQKLLIRKFSLVPELPHMHPDLDIGISDDPAVVPVGRWLQLNLRRNYIRSNLILMNVVILCQ